MTNEKDPEKLLGFVLKDGERVCYAYQSTAKRLRDDGARQFFLPAAAAGIFLILAGSVCYGLFGRWAGVLAFLGMMLCATGVIFYAMFLRMARRAQSCALYLTERAVIVIRDGTYARLPLSDISEASAKKEERLSRLPFDISQLEIEFIVLSYRGDEMRIPYIENAPDAAKRIAHASAEWQREHSTLI